MSENTYIYNKHKKVNIAIFKVALPYFDCTNCLYCTVLHHILSPAVWTAVSIVPPKLTHIMIFLNTRLRLIGCG